ncbi:MAG: RNA methyltransferase [Oscillospiraceae bacterium]|nr:RNA methyltransferase [Oscillospiraceae bacterium]
MQLLSSRQNPRIAELEALLTHKKNRDTALFACEGARLCEDAVQAGLTPEAVYLTEKAALRYPETASLVTGASRAVYALDECLAGRISDTVNPQGVFCVFKKLDNAPQAVKIVSGGKYFLLSGIQDPGNLGTIIRTAEAFGISGVFLDSDCPDLYAPKVQRASMGAVFRLPRESPADIRETIAVMRENGIPVYAAALTEDAIPLRGGLFRGGAAVLIGNEGAGLSRDLTGRCDAACVIPMTGGVQSLNAAMAATVFAWEMMNS